MKTNRIKYYVLGEECGNIASYGYYKTTKDAEIEVKRLSNFFENQFFYVEASHSEPFQVNV